MNAHKGGGAFMNGKKISVSKTCDLQQAVLINNIGATRDEAFCAANIARVHAVLRAPCRAIRLGGSAAQNCCYVANGRIDAFWETGFGGPWDVAAGSLLVIEAGGVAVDAPSGAPFRLMPGKGNILLGNEAIVCAVTERLSKPPEHAAPLWQLATAALAGAILAAAVLNGR